MKKILSVLIALTMILGLFSISMADTIQTRLVSAPGQKTEAPAEEAGNEEEAPAEEAGNEEAAPAEEGSEEAAPAEEGNEEAAPEAAEETAEAAEEAAEGKSDVAYIMYADASWTNQYWGTDDSAVKAENAVVTGAGDYTVALDFSAVEGGAAQGLAFIALGIVNGENTFPGATLKINEIRVNGEAIEVGKGYTSSDDGVTTRMNIFNEWVSALPEDARSFDGDLTDCSWIIVDKDAFASVAKVEIDFTLQTVTDTAYIMFADTNWTVQYWGNDDGSGVVANNAVVEGEGTYTVSLDFTGTALGAASGTAFAAVGIMKGEENFPGWFINIKEVKVNGEAVEFGKGFTTSDDGVTTRVNLYNEWVSTVPDTARVEDGDLSGVSAIIVDKSAFDVIQTIEVTFDYVYGEAPVTESAALTEEEAAALCAADYNAYIALQCKDNYTFRNAWNDTYGRDDANNPGYFDRLTGWEGNDAVDYGGTFTDAILTVSGTYSVSVTLGEMGLGATDAFNLLFVSTDIPSKLVEGGFVTIGEVKTKIGEQSTKEYTEVDTSGDYVLIKVLDTYNQSSEPFGYTMPQAGETITITFTVEGLTD